ncbi:TerB N-terminal domain-containing protein [Azospirillum sp. TSH20]|uniref:tellurite resistance TerB family protein n=1 Tax=Azospirillum sp. TSH20 TaxID=652754 RepID=UPI001FFFEBC0|nr:TerB N-terminal domain-containing protein [Azospirillum sp. TSH20]
MSAKPAQMATLLDAADENARVALLRVNPPKVEMAVSTPAEEAGNGLEVTKPEAKEQAAGVEVTAPQFGDAGSPSPGEMNRRRVTEILARKAPLSAPNPPPPPAPTPGEMNRQRVAEILTRNAPLSPPLPAKPLSPPAVQSPTLFGEMADTIDWSNLGLGRTQAAPSPPPPPPALAEAGGWVPAGRSVTVAGITIADGMVYVGRHLPRLDRAGTENCLIDPSLPVRSGTTQWRIGYFPSYAGLDPVYRYAYLRWLADGRSTPEADMGLVFLFFYGLERRLIGDRSQADAPAIIAEVERLRRVYGANASFMRYSGQLLTMARLMFEGVPGEPPDLHDRNWEMPLDLKVGLGHRVATGEAIRGDWMLAWLHCDPDLVWRTPAMRAPEQFRALFLRRFAERFPNGITVKPPQRKLRPAYQACSGTFRASVSIEVAGAELPDVAALSAPLTKARPLAETCMDALDPYSRFLGRSPERRDSLEAFALLPAELRETPPPAVEGLRRWLDGLAADRPALVPWTELLQRVNGALPDKPGKRDVQGLASSLAVLGYGIEPDPAFGGRLPRQNEPLALFRIVGDGMRDGAPDGAASDAYRNALLRLTLAVMVAGADGSVAAEERALLAAHIADAPDLSEDERRRLAAHVHWLEACPPDRNALKSRAAALPVEARDNVGRLAIAMAAADGRVDAEEIMLLQRLYKLLGLNPDTLYSDLHALGAEDRGGSGPIGGPAATAPEPDASAGLRLDPERIRRIQADTARVSSVLGSVFADEVAVPETPPPVAAADDKEDADEDDPFDGLDSQHRTLLRELCAAERWSRDDYMALARSLELMPDGAIETINEWAFDRFDEAILDDDDPITVTLSLLQPSMPEPAAHV